jgi:TonB family protein
MGKIVKYCTACEESFAEKFSFCPNCAGELSAFEMKPISQEPEVAAAPTPVISDEPNLELSDSVNQESSFVNEPAETVAEDVSLIEDSNIENESDIEVDKSETVFEPVNFNADETEEEQINNAFSNEEKETSNEEEETHFVESSEEVEDVPETIAATGTYAAAETIDDVDIVDDADVVYDDYREEPVSSSNFSDISNNYAEENTDDGGYHITVIQEKGVKQRNMLLLGSAVLMITLTLAGVVYSIFDKTSMVGAISDENLMALINLDETPIEAEEPPKKKDDDKGGGGGGGGKQEKTETSKGVLADQTEKPQFPPTSRAVRLTNPDLMIKRSTQGTIKRPPTDEPYGNPNSTSSLTSDGKGSGGGMGSGRGTGQGSGVGTGEGSGIGSGSGSGRGNGIGSGDGDGTGDRNPKPPAAPPPPRDPPPAGPTTGIQILSKPRPGYTDSARTNNVQGTVMLSVTFLSSGQIGGVSAVKGLPDGLTEKAIAAARQIQFKPALVNGRPQTVTKRIQYNFTIY